MWSYPYYGVPVYGTGYVYPPYWGAVYYPRPPTWGLHVGYNPWTGWRFGVSWSNGFMTVGASWGYGGGAYYRPGGCCGGWYGGGYRRPVVVHHHHGNVNIGNTVNIGNSINRGGRVNSGNQVSHHGARQRPSQPNLYRQGANSARATERMSAGRDLNQARPASGRANDVFADKSGSVARRSGEQWQVRDSGTWKSSGGLQDRPAPGGSRDFGAGDSSRSPGAPSRDFSSQQPSTRPAQGWSAPTSQSISSSGRPSPNIDRSDLNRAAQARQSGMNRQRASPSFGSGFGGGGRRR